MRKKPLFPLKKLQKIIVMRANKLLFAVLILIGANLYAQNPKKANIWYFGMNAGLDFSNGNPTVITNGAMTANEGTVSISDIDGNLLFYSNGGSRPTTGAIWNRNHQIMLNGSLDATTRGCGSSIQPAIIVPQPGKRDIYYMFTTDCRENNSVGGLSYNIIDMNLDGGLGGVVQKSIGVIDYTTESVAAAKHGNAKDYWIIVNKVETDSFFAYQLTKDGITGVVKSSALHISTRDAGEIKVSSNGERLFFADGNTSVIYKFNKNTGEISEGVDLGNYSYTAVFSPDCERLYITDFGAKKIYQYTVTAKNIAHTKTLIGTSAGYIGTLQLGPDGKAYLARRNSTYLGVINNPNLRGTACNYIDNGVSLGSAQSKFGLPNYANDVLGECASYPEENTTNYDYAFHPGHINENKIQLVWNPFQNAISYRIGMRANVGENWTSFYTDKSEIDIANLNSDTEYEFRIEEIIYPNGVYTPVDGHTFNSDGEYSSTATSIKVKTLNEFNYNIYPNPAKDKASIDINTGDTPVDVEMKIFDASGKIVYTDLFESVSGFNSFPISLSNLTKGIYNITITSENITGNKRLVVMN
jgi:hypothetical protein